MLSIVRPEFKWGQDVISASNGNGRGEWVCCVASALNINLDGSLKCSLPDVGSLLYPTGNQVSTMRIEVQDFKDRAWCCNEH